MSSGQFTVALDFGANFPGADRWLEIGVRTNGNGAFTTLTPRQKITPTPYAITAGNLNGTLPGNQLPSNVALLDANETFTAGVSFNGGNVGIGVSSPVSRLDVRAPANDVISVANALTYWRGNNQGGGLILGTQLSYPVGTWIQTTVNDAPGTTPLFLNPSGGNVGIGTTSPSVKLEVAGSLKVTGTGNSITTPVLSITGGSDVAEPFAMSGVAIPKGAVVVIDDAHPGQLKLSERAYDKRVAGIVSGAGGVNPGLTLSQRELVEGGQNVALTGRVYALADAANGPIQPGDLLTTSSIPGHAMKVTNPAKSQGAILGKAMSRLESGRGLVLVLVTLQ